MTEPVKRHFGIVGHFAKVQIEPHADEQDIRRSRQAEALAECCENKVGVRFRNRNDGSLQTMPGQTGGA